MTESVLSNPRHPPNWYDNFITTADFTGLEGQLVKMGAAEIVSIVTADTDYAIGQVNIVRDWNLKGDSKGHVEVLLFAPWRWAIAAAAITSGVDVAPNATDGSVKTAAAADQIVGLTIGAAGAAQDLIKIIPFASPLLA